MAKTTAMSAAEFLSALSNTPELFTTHGVTVELRALTYAEVQRLVNLYKDDSNEMAFQAVQLGLVAPVLDGADLEQVRNGRAGPIMAIAKRVMEVSGMVDSPGPLAGNGLSEP